MLLFPLKNCERKTLDRQRFFKMLHDGGGQYVNTM